MRCLLIAPSGVNLDVLLAVLGDLDVEVLFTSDLAAGAALAHAAFEQVDFGVAIVPAGPADRAGLAAVYVEIGVVAGRGLPVLVVVEPPVLPSPALSGLTTVSTTIDNDEALRLHLGLFVRSAAATPIRATPQRPATLASTISADYRARLETVRSAPRDRSGSAFEQLVSDLLRDAGAQVEERPIGAGDYGVDMAAFFPGQENQLGTLLVEVKSGRLSSRAFQKVQERLSTQVLHTRSGLGLLVYNEAVIDPQQRPSTPLVFSLAIDELLTELERRPLGEVLVQARNRAIHGI